MATIKNYKQFVNELADKNFKFLKRYNELVDFKSTILESNSTYLIEVTFEYSDSLLEHENIIKFKKTKNRYYGHSEKTNPPVKAHYHVIPSNGKQEIYAVNIDGTAHHRANKGYEIPRKEATELRALGVDIKPNNIIENVEFLDGEEMQMLNESLQRDCISIIIEIEA